MCATATMALAGALAAGACQHVPPRPLSPAATAAALAGRSLDAPELARFVAAALGRAPNVWPPRRWDLPTLTLAALWFQPSLGVARAHAAAAGAAVTTARAWPNPTLALTPEYSTNAVTVPSPWLAAVHLDWTIETAGKRRRRLERARANAEAAGAAVTGEAWRVRRQLAAALVTLAATRARAATLAAEVAADERLVALAAGRERAGAASAAAAAPLRMALLQATTEQATAAAAVAEALSGVAAAVGVPTQALAELALPSGLDDDERLQLLALAPDAARRCALLGRADLRQALAAYAATEAGLALELARQYPDVHLGPGYQFDQGQNKWSVGLSVDLPLLNRNEGPIAEAVAARAEAAAQLLAVQAAALAEVERALARRDGATSRVARELATLAARERELRRAHAALAAGALDRTAVVVFELERTRAARAAAEAESALAQALVDLEAVIEGPPSALPAVVADAP
ncbi:MAG: TolC family protein [Myxococcales bacterium]|jgi:outer membrane protein TolC|nr:TolC family protein [Myxococcales bacterium]